MNTKTTIEQLIPIKKIGPAEMDILGLNKRQKQTVNKLISEYNETYPVLEITSYATKQKQKTKKILIGLATPILNSTDYKYIEHTIGVNGDVLKSADFRGRGS